MTRVWGLGSRVKENMGGSLFMTLNPTNPNPETLSEISPPPARCSENVQRGLDKGLHLRILRRDFGFKV